MEVQEESVPLLTNGGTGLARRVWEESKKLWAVVGPSMIGRLALYGMCVITQAYAGHVGDLELASFSIATTVVASFAFGFMVCHPHISHVLRKRRERNTSSFAGVGHRQQRCI
ncbi:hypothetical protein C4D60_Mb07t16440 [Musa balbisiana]|uniref:Protein DETOXIFICATION n=1 Tax=Musa balbisiana TaxID=52838 RepID=A0A4S8JGZ3_MUSBA|nr:hypothetical protein C4D60_Mb07t16440 [Musa balbisiana]